MRVIEVWVIAVFLLIRSVSGQQSGAFEFAKQKQAETPRYFDDYGHVNTHFDQELSNTTFWRSNTSVLSNLFKSYASTMQDLGITSWLAQGTLLSWYWNHKVFPWETDVDMHMTLPDLQFLAKFYNMTVYQFRFSDMREGEVNQYLLDINPHYPERFVHRLDNNQIDARWVDMSNGAYIDVTAIHPLDPHAQEKGKPMLWQTKDGHVYNDEDIYPLQRTVYEGVEAFVPKNPAKLSSKEYGDKSLTQDVFRGYKFDRDEEQWVQISPDAAD